MSKNARSIWFDVNLINSYDCLFNFITGNRGGGKTYSTIKWCIERFIKSGEQFIYLRRYESEFDKGKKEQFFNAFIKNEEFPDYEFKVTGFIGYIRKKAKDKEKEGEWEPLVKFMALSTSRNEKSVPFPKVKRIIFDEFLIDPKDKNKHYLNDEIITFFELYETVCRLRLDENNQVDLNAEPHVFFLGNALTTTNIYFMYFDIKPRKSSKPFRVKKDVCVQFYTNEDFIKLKKQTRFGQLIKGSKFEKYSIDNEFLRDDKTFIGRKNVGSFCRMVWKYNDKIYGIWIDGVTGGYVVSEDYDKDCGLRYSLTLPDHSENYILFNSTRDVYIKSFKEHYIKGLVRFENMNLKNIFYDIMKKFFI